MARTPLVALGALLPAVAGIIVGTAGPASAGVSGPAFYVDHQLYRTVGTPTDLSGTEAPAQGWDRIYEFGGVQPNVATAAPGDVGYTGGRWQVHGLAFPNGYSAAITAADADADGVLDSAAEVNAAMAAGAATDIGVVKQFECPVIPLAHGR